MQQLFYKWRPVKYDTSLNLWDCSLNWWYTLAFRYNWSRKDYVDQCSVNIKDQIVQDDKYLDIWAVSEKPRLGKMFWVVEFDETKISAEDLWFDLVHDFPDYWVRILSKQEAIDFIRDFTTCLEDSLVFTVRDETTEYMTQNVIPAVTINLN